MVALWKLGRNGAELALCRFDGKPQALWRGVIVAFCRRKWTGSKIASAGLESVCEGGIKLILADVWHDSCDTFEFTMVACVQSNRALCEVCTRGCLKGTEKQ